MWQEQIFLYIRENGVIAALTAGGILLLLWLLVFIQVTRTRREVHKICKKIYRYFEVILADDTQAPQEEADGENVLSPQIPVYQAAETSSAKEEHRAKEARKTEEDVKLLMDVISEVF